MLRSAFRYPLRGDRAVETLLVGGGLHLLSATVPVAPLVVVAGYLVRVLGRTAATDRPELRATAEPPRFAGIARLVRDGVVGVALAYLLAPTLILLVTVDAALSRPGIPSGSAGLAVSLGGVTTLVAALAFVYPLPAALANYGATGRVRAAFDLSALRRAAADARYFVAFWAAAVVLAGIAAVGEPLNAVALGFFVAFYAEVVVAVLLRAGCGDALGRERLADAGADDRPASP